MILGPDGLYRAMVRFNGQLCVQVVDMLGPDEVAVSFDEPEPPRTVTPTIDGVALEDLLGRCRGGGVSEHAVTVAPNTGAHQGE